jgi:subtilisin family serine protease
LVRPIFRGTGSATPEELAAAIFDCVEAGARVLNLSLVLASPATRREHMLEEALDHAMGRGVIVVAAAGNEGSVASSAVTRHPWVIAVVGCDLQGRPLGSSNLAASIGRRGLRAPGDRIISLDPGGASRTLSGTSFAAPFVTGTAALLRSAFPGCGAAELRQALLRPARGSRTGIVPPILDAEASYCALADSGTLHRRTAA